MFFLQGAHCLHKCSAYTSSIIPYDYANKTFCLREVQLDTGLFEWCLYMYYCSVPPEQNSYIVPSKYGGLLLKSFVARLSQESNSYNAKDSFHRELSIEYNLIWTL